MVRKVTLFCFHVVTGTAYVFYLALTKKLARQYKVICTFKMFFFEKPTHNLNFIVYINFRAVLNFGKTWHTKIVFHSAVGATPTWGRFIFSVSVSSFVLVPKHDSCPSPPREDRVFFQPATVKPLATLTKRTASNKPDCASVAQSCLRTCCSVQHGHVSLLYAKDVFQRQFHERGHFRKCQLFVAHSANN